MPQTLKKLKGYIALGLSFCLSVHLFVRWLQKESYSLEISLIDLSSKIVDPYFLIKIISLCGVMPLLKAYIEVL